MSHRTSMIWMIAQDFHLHNSKKCKKKRKWQKNEWNASGFCKLTAPNVELRVIVPKSLEKTSIDSEQSTCHCWWKYWFCWALQHIKSDDRNKRRERSNEKEQSQLKLMQSYETKYMQNKNYLMAFALTFRYCMPVKL